MRFWRIFMQRLLAIMLMFGVVGLAYCYAQPQGKRDAKSPSKLSALQRERIDILKHRVSQLESLFKTELVDRADLIRSRIDLINARLDYAQTGAQKRSLLAALITEYDQLIQIGEMALRAPPQPQQPGQRNTAMPKASSELLWLKSERVRIQITREMLN